MCEKITAGCNQQAINNDKKNPLGQFHFKTRLKFSNYLYVMREDTTLDIFGPLFIDKIDQKYHKGKKYE